MKLDICLQADIFNSVLEILFGINLKLIVAKYITACSIIFGFNVKIH